MSFRWVPTSSNLLEVAEKRLLHRHVKRPFRLSSVQVSNADFIHTLDTHTESNTESRNEPLVLAHGFGAGLGLWYSNLDHLRGRVICFDWLGMGRSSRPKFLHIRSPWTEFSPAQVAEAEQVFVDSLEQWRKEMGLNEFHLLGHSLGGYLSTCYGLKYPKRLKNLILLSPVGIPDAPLITEEEKREMKRAAKNLPWPVRLLENGWNWNFTPQSFLRAAGPYGPKFMSSVIARRFAASNLPEADLEDLGRYLYHVSVAPASSEMGLNTLLEPWTSGPYRGIYARVPLSLPDRLPRLVSEGVPCHLIFGSRDWMFHPSIHQFVKKVQAGVKNKSDISLHVIENAGHHIYLDNREQFHSVVNEITRL